jgi:hypothetical protein
MGVPTDEQPTIATAKIAVRTIFTLIGRSTVIGRQAILALMMIR